MKIHTTSRILPTAIALAALASAADIDLAGTVKDKSTGAALKDVVVRLQGRSASDTTDAQGAFRIVSSSTGIAQRSTRRTAPIPSGEGVRIDLARECDVSVRTYSVGGDLLASTDERMAAGVHELTFSVKPQGITLHRIRIGDETYVVRQSRCGQTVHTGIVTDAASGEAGRGLAEAFSDTLVATANGYIQNRLAVATASATGLQIQLEKQQTSASSKPRMIITTDLGADPDDLQSLVRYLVSSNEFETEGIVVATSCWKKSQANTSMFDNHLAAYKECYANLKAHADGYPTYDQLKAVTVLGQKGYSMADVGAGKDSPGSDLIIAAVDRNDPRPVWVGAWGGNNTLAQAVWKVQNTRSASELAKFLSKIRVYDILGQDEAGAWLAKTFPDLFYIRATAVYGWQPTDAWLSSNVQNKGKMGSVYPNRAWANEGDTPAFLHMFPNGLNDPEKIDQGGWGGRFSFSEKAGIRSMSAVTGEAAYDTYLMYPNTSEGSSAISKWSDGYNNDFAARMIWSTTGNYGSANHHPIAVVNGDATRNVLTVTATAGSDLVINTTGSKDPDGNTLSWTWQHYKEAGTYGGNVTIQGGNNATVKVPSDAKGKTIHVILLLQDSGTPKLTAYRRVIIDVK